MLEDFIWVQKKALAGTKESLSKLPALMGHILVYQIIFMIFALLFSRLAISGGFFLGIILAIIKAGLFSHLLFTLDGIVNNNKVYWKEELEGFTSYLNPAITAFFTYYILELIIDLAFSNLTRNFIIYQLVRALIFLLFSAVAESIYIKGDYSYQSIESSYRMSRDNPLNWALVNLILYLVFYRLGINLDVFTSIESFSTTMVRGVYIILEVAVLSLYLIYRGKLYTILYQSSRRKRDYMRGQDETDR